MKSFLIVFAGVIAAMAAVVALAKFTAGTAQTPSVTVGEVRADAAEFNFGNVSMKNGIVTHIFNLANSGSGAVAVRRVYTSCMCTKATLKVAGRNIGPFGMPGHGFTSSLNEVIPSGAAFAVVAEFDPAAHGPAGVGPISRMITVETDKGRVTLAFRAVVTP